MAQIINWKLMQFKGLTCVKLNLTDIFTQRWPKCHQKHRASCVVGQLLHSSVEGWCFLRYHGGQEYGTETPTKDKIMLMKNWNTNDYDSCPVMNQ